MQSRDLTVPSGTPSSWAISAGAQVGQVAQDDDLPLIDVELRQGSHDRHMVGAQLG